MTVRSKDDIHKIPLSSLDKRKDEHLHRAKQLKLTTTDGEDFKNTTLFVFQTYNWKEMKIAEGIRRSFRALQPRANRKQNDIFYKNKSCTLSTCDSILWFQTICNDDIECYDRLIEDLDTDQKLLLMNGSFWYDLYYRQVCVERRVHLNLNFHFPIMLAACYRAKNCLLRILRDGADVEQTDQSGYNIFHALALASAATPDFEHQYMDVLRLVTTLLPPAKLHRMARTEDTNKFFPLELAAKVGAYGIFRLLLNTDDAHVRILCKTGIHHHVIIDVTEYEDLYNRDRRLRSPLRFMARMRTCHLKSFVENHVLDLSVVQAWIRFKVRRTWPYVFFWCAVRSVYLLLLIALDIVVENLNILSDWLGESDVRIGDAVHATVAALCASMAVCHVSEWVFHTLAKERKVTQARLLPLKAEESHLAYTLMYRAISFTLCIIVGAMFLLRFFALDVSYYLFLKPLVLLICLLSYLEILEVLPLFETFAIVLQKTVPYLFRYLGVQFIVKIVFAVHFYHVCQMSSRPPEYACIPDGYTDNDPDIANGSQLTFQSIKQSIHDMVVLDFSTVQFGTDPPSDIVLARVLYYLIGVVLLISFLVAIMSTIVATYWRHGKLLAKLRQIELMFLAEDRIGFAIRLLDAKTRPYQILVTQTADEGNMTDSDAPTTSRPV